MTRIAFMRGLTCCLSLAVATAAVFAAPPHPDAVAQAENAAPAAGTASSAACVADANTLCLNAGRFQVTADWEKLDGSSGKGTAVSLTQDTGYFWFFNPSNIEVVTKVLAFCSNPFNSYWVFAAGLTNVKTTLTFTDTKNGTIVVKENPQSTPFVPVQDTKAFLTCP